MPFFPSTHVHGSRRFFLAAASQLLRKNGFLSNLVFVLRTRLAKKEMPGGHLLSRTVSSAVPSADRVLTVVFGMGTGVSPGRIAARCPSV